MSGIGGTGPLDFHVVFVSKVDDMWMSFENDSPCTIFRPKMSLFGSQHPPPTIWKDKAYKAMANKIGF